MDITLLCVEECPHVEVARQRLVDAIGRLGLVVVPTEQVVRTEAEAAATGFQGSPTILVDGSDPFPATGSIGMSCRLYSTEAGLQGAPTVEQLVEVLAR